MIGTPSAQEETIAYSLQVKGAEAAGVAPDDIAMVSKFYQDVEDTRGAAEFVQNVATGDFGNDSYGWKPMVAGIPTSAHTAKNHLKAPVYARFSVKDNSGVQRITLSNNEEMLASAKELIGNIFQVTDTRWTKNQKKVRLTLFLRPVPAR